MIIKVSVSDPITYEGQPDGGRTPIIDPYDGCQFRCPYCWQFCDDTWNKDIYVNINIADLLKNRLCTWDKTETIYLGSRCDPYMPIEEQYRLTRSCLATLDELQINTMITTKSDNRLIFRDIDIIKNFRAEITVLMGLANINQIDKGSLSQNILTANELSNNGIAVWSFITPVLPYIMDVEEIILALSPDITMIFLDKLRIDSTVQSKKMTDFIERYYPSLKGKYHKIINEKDESYFNEIISKYSNNDRIKILF